MIVAERIFRDHALVFQQYARNLAALEMLAGGFRLIFFEAGKACTEQGLIAFHGPFGEGGGLG